MTHAHMTHAHSIISTVYLAASADGMKFSLYTIFIVSVYSCECSPNVTRACNNQLSECQLHLLAYHNYIPFIHETNSSQSGHQEDH